MEFIKGYIIEVDEEKVFIGEGEFINIITVQGEIFSNVELTGSSKKRLGFQIEGELSSRVLELDLIESIEKV